jgi:hypothetical protein
MHAHIVMGFIYHLFSTPFSLWPTPSNIHKNHCKCSITKLPTKMALNMSRQHNRPHAILPHLIRHHLTSRVEDLPADFLPTYLGLH